MSNQNYKINNNVEIKGNISTVGVISGASFMAGGEELAKSSQVEALSANIGGFEETVFDIDSSIGIVDVFTVPKNNLYGGFIKVKIFFHPYETPYAGNQISGLGYVSYKEYVCIWYKLDNQNDTFEVIDFSKLNPAEWSFSYSESDLQIENRTNEIAFRFNTANYANPGTPHRLYFRYEITT